EDVHQARQLHFIVFVLTLEQSYFGFQQTCIFPQTFDYVRVGLARSAVGLFGSGQRSDIASYSPRQFRRIRLVSEVKEPVDSKIDLAGALAVRGDLFVEAPIAESPDRYAGYRAD